MKRIIAFFFMTVMAPICFADWSDPPTSGITTGTWHGTPITVYTQYGITAQDTQQWHYAWLVTSGAVPGCIVLTNGSAISVLVNDKGYIQTIPAFSGIGTTGSVTSVAGDAGKYLKADATWGVPLGAGDMLKSDNLSGLTNYAMARINLGLGNSATCSVSQFATSAQGTKSDTALQSEVDTLQTVVNRGAIATNLSVTLGNMVVDAFGPALFLHSVSNNAIKLSNNSLWADGANPGLFFGTLYATFDSGTNLGSYHRFNVGASERMRLLAYGIDLKSGIISNAIWSGNNLSNTQITGLGTASTNNSGDFLASSTQYYPSNNPAGYISSVGKVSSATNADYATTANTASNVLNKVSSATNSDTVGTLVTAQIVTNIIGGTNISVSGQGTSTLTINNSDPDNYLTNGSANVVLTGNVVINGNDSAAGDGFRPQHNGLQVIGKTDGSIDTYLGLGGKTNIPAWFFQTYRNEGSTDTDYPEFLYPFSNEKSHRDIAVVSEGGRFGLNKVSNVNDYHMDYLGYVGGALDDCNMVGTNTYSKQRAYKVSIAITGATDQWTWAKSTDDGATFTAQGVTNYCATTNMALENGTYIYFENTTGHNTTDAWQRTAYAQLPQSSFHVAPSWYAEIGISTNFANQSGWSDVTYTLANTTHGSDRTILATTNAALYLGRNIKMNSTYLTFSTFASGLTMVIEYYNGTNWIAIDSSKNLVDGTVNMTSSGQISWDKNTMLDWAKFQPSNQAASYNMYWLRFRTTTLPTIAPVISQATPHSKTRLGLMLHQFDNTYGWYVDGIGATYGSKFYQTDNTSAYGTNQLTTDTRVQFLIKSAQGTYYYPQTNLFLADATARGMNSSAAATQFAFTNAVVSAGGGTNFLNTFVITNATIGTTQLVAGLRYTAANEIASSAGGTVYEYAQLIEWNKGYTNVLATSGKSLLIPNGIGTISEISLSLTLPTNVAVASTNYLGMKFFVTTGNNGNIVTYYGGQNNSYFIQGSSSSLGNSGVTSIKNTDGNITLSPTNGMGDVTLRLSQALTITNLNINGNIQQNGTNITSTALTNAQSANSVIFAPDTNTTHIGWSQVPILSMAGFTNINALVPDGNLNMNAKAVTNASLLDVSGQTTIRGNLFLNYSSGTASAAVTNQCSFWVSNSASAVLYVQNGAGTSTKLSSHDDVSNDLVAEDEVPYTGEHRQINLMKLARAVEAISAKLAAAGDTSFSEFTNILTVTAIPKRDWRTDHKGQVTGTATLDALPAYIQDAQKSFDALHPDWAVDKAGVITIEKKDVKPVTEEDSETITP